MAAPGRYRHESDLSYLAQGVDRFVHGCERGIGKLLHHSGIHVFGAWMAGPRHKGSKNQCTLRRDSVASLRKPARNDCHPGFRIHWLRSTLSLDYEQAEPPTHPSVVQHETSALSLRQRRNRRAFRGEKHEVESKHLTDHSYGADGIRRGWNCVREPLLLATSPSLLETRSSSNGVSPASSWRRTH
jgi:hypothetical protein